MLETINQTAKLEFDFLLNGLKTLELITIEPEEIINLIDRNTKILKQKVRLLNLEHFIMIRDNKIFLFLAV